MTNKDKILNLIMYFIIPIEFGYQTNVVIKPNIGKIDLKVFVGQLPKSWFIHLLITI